MIALLLCAIAEAGAWTRGYGSYYFKVGADFYTAPQYASPATQVPGTTAAGLGPYFGQQYGAYGELGLLDPAIWRVQLALQAPLSVGRTSFLQEDTFGALAGHATVTRLGDVRLTPQVALAKRAPVAAGLEVKVPGYRNDSVCAGNPYRVYCPRPGEGQVDLTPYGAAGTPFAEHGFAEGRLGWRFRTDIVLGAEGPSVPLGDGPTWAATVGWTAGPVLAMVQADGVHVLGEDLVTPQAVRGGPAALWTLDDDLGLALEARFSADLWARATSRGYGGGLGVSLRGPGPGGGD